MFSSFLQVSTPSGAALAVDLQAELIFRFNQVAHLPIFYYLSTWHQGHHTTGYVLLKPPQK